MNDAVVYSAAMCSLTAVYCCAEVDSFGHFFMKAKTGLADNPLETVWDAVRYTVCL